MPASVNLNRLFGLCRAQSKAKGLEAGDYALPDGQGRATLRTNWSAEALCRLGLAVCLLSGLLLAGSAAACPICGEPSVTLTERLAGSPFTLPSGATWAAASAGGTSRAAPTPRTRG